MTCGPVRVRVMFYMSSVNGEITFIHSSSTLNLVTRGAGAQLTLGEGSVQVTSHTRSHSHQFRINN